MIIYNSNILIEKEYYEDKTIFTVFVFIIVFLTVSITCDQAPKPDLGRDAAFISMRERFQIIQKFWDWKKENVLPMIMRELGVDILYYNNEGPVYTFLIPANYEGMAFPGIHEPTGSQ